MNKKENFFDFCTNKYPLSKTLRFELCPVEKTKELIREVKEKKDKNSPLAPLILEDEKKAEAYKQVKPLIDNLHKKFLKFALNEANIKGEDKEFFERNIKDFYSYYNDLGKSKKDKNLEEIKKTQKKIKGIQIELAKKLISVLDDNSPEFSKEKLREKQQILDEKIENLEESIKSLKSKKDDVSKETKSKKEKEKKALEKTREFKFTESKQLYSKAESLFNFLGLYYIKSDKKTKKIEKFDKFHTYFIKFLKNRENIYDIKGKKEDNSFHFLSTSIVHRLFEENISFHFDNIKKWERVKAKIEKSKEELKQKNWNFKDKLNTIESKLGFKLEGILQPQSFVKWFSQDGIDQYNEFLGGKSAKEGKEKIQGLNELINLTRQKIKDSKKADFPSLKEFHKQILSDRETFVEIIENHEDLYTEIDKHIKNEEKLLNSLEKENKEQDLRSFKELLEELKDNKGKIYIKKDHLRFFSHDLTSNWNELENWYLAGFTTDEEKKANAAKEIITIEELEKSLSKEREREGVDKSLNFYHHFIKPLKEDKKRPWIKEIKEDDIFFSYFKAKFKYLIQKIGENSIEDLIKNKIIYIESLENTKKEEGFLTKKEKDSVKKYLDASQDIFRFFRSLNINEKDLKKGEQQNTSWVETISEGFLKKNNISILYNKARNFLTKKEYSTEKFKLNFENPTLANGWDKNREVANLCVILRKDDLYYLAVMNKDSNKVFEEIEDLKEKNNEFYEKVIYKLLPGPNKMLFKVFFSGKNIKYYSPSKEIWKIRNTGSHTEKGKSQSGFTKENFNLEDCHKMIDFLKESIKKHPEWKNFHFKFSQTKEFNSIDKFYKEISDQGYKISFKNISKDYIDKLINEQKIYLFQIYNKDFSQNKKGKGTDNIHTLYWKVLFEKKNMEDVVVKLNGEAELFYRKASIFYKDKKMEEGHHAKKLEGKFSYPIIKDKRYTMDKIFFHSPITLNYKAKNEYNINEGINECLKNEHQKVNIIGIDRGERNLLSYSVIDQEGKIIEQGNLNFIDSVNYHEKLEDREQKRRKARENWQTIANIKELKEGYLSQVVHQIAKMVVKHNAIVVLEDLNRGFKKGRMKFEKQVYQKFEVALINKLNYLVFKDKKLGELGHILQAYQLTNKFESFQKLGKQSGILFYTAAAYTSRTDPVTGYMQSLYPQYVNKEKAKKFFSNFKSIVYNGTHFEFTYCLEDLKGMTGSYENEDEFDETLKKAWTIHSHVDRSRSKYVKNNKENKREWEDAKINESIKELFEKESFENKDFQLQEGKDYKDIIGKNKAFNDRNKFLAKLTAHFKRLLDMRVYGEEEDKKIDYILSPVEPFYDSRKITRDFLPKDSDMNGAYNIARKGIIILKKNRASDSNLSIAKKEWMKYVQDEEIIRKQKAKYKEIVNNRKMS